LTQVAVRVADAKVPAAAADIPWFLCAGSHGHVDEPHERRQKAGFEKMDRRAA
jgi:hypothetical protein